MVRRVLSIGLLAGLAACSEGAPEDLLQNGTPLYSQRKEELIIRHFFDDRRDGVFLDVGCYHWEDISTTLYLEKHLGWSGIAIDALDRFRAGYEENRPNTRFHNYLVGSESGGTGILYLSGPTSSTSPTWRKERFPNKPIGELKEIEVPRITLDDLLDREGITEIDFVSMDIEGGELDALAGFSLERFRPELLCIEGDPGAREALNEHLRSRGYEPIEAYKAHDMVNVYYQRTSESATNRR